MGEKREQGFGTRRKIAGFSFVTAAKGGIQKANNMSGARLPNREGRGMTAAGLSS
jgi:hypothetical protein